MVNSKSTYNKKKIKFSNTFVDIFFKNNYYDITIRNNNCLY